VALLPFRSRPAVPALPPGYVLEPESQPTARAIDALLQACGEPSIPEERWMAALERSLWCLSVRREHDDRLAGFVRATSDRALNANLWNLCAHPGDSQGQDLPGCSISISAPPAALQALKDQGFVLDPGGIRAMGLWLR
jgi:hypothetical protein